MAQLPRASSTTFAHNDGPAGSEVLKALERFNKLVADAGQLADDPALPDGRRLMCSLFLDAQATSLARQRTRRRSPRHAPQIVITVPLPVRAGGAR